MSEAPTSVILNVDDHEPTRYARRRVLESSGYQVYDCGTGSEAIDLAARHELDLVLLDVHLPDLDGLSVCKELKSGPQGSSLLVLQISATAAGTNMATAALNNGADAYLTEPVDPDVLLATARALLRLRASERAVAEANHRLETLNKQLERSNADLRQFARLVNQDLKEPLRTIHSSIDALLNDSKGKLKQTALNHAEFIQAGAQRMNDLLDSVLALADLGEHSLRKSPVDLGTVVDTAIENLSLRIKESGAEMHFVGHFLGTLPVVLGDVTQLVRVIQNLVTNSIVYRRKEAPRIVLNCETGACGECLLSVTDNGLGIPDAERERVFEAFHRLHEEIPGAGIGLAVSRRIVELHDGNIWCEGATGGGTRIVISLPIVR